MRTGREDRSDGGVFDTVVADAWEQFETNLASKVAALTVGTYITITSAQASHGQRGQRPYVDVVAVDADQTLGVASLPSYLYPDASSIEVVDRRFHGLGWSEPGRPTADGTVMDYVIDVAPDESDLLVTMTVATFREVWNVPHPSFLSAWRVGQNGEQDGPVSLAHPTLPPTPARDAEPPVGLRSLHAWCEVVGARVDAATVLAVCGEDDLDELARRALVHADNCAARSAQCSRNGERTASRVWCKLARSWNDTATSLRGAVTQSGSALSREDRPAKSTGS